MKTTETNFRPMTQEQYKCIEAFIDVMSDLSIRYADGRVKDYTFGFSPQHRDIAYDRKMDTLHIYIPKSNTLPFSKAFALIDSFGCSGASIHTDGIMEFWIPRTRFEECVTTKNLSGIHMFSKYLVGKTSCRIKYHSYIDGVKGFFRRLEYSVEVIDGNVMFRPNNFLRYNFSFWD